jgi:hypothetical protein
MDLKHIEHLVYAYILWIKETPTILNEFKTHKYSLDRLQDEVFSKTSWDLTICSYCSNAQILFDMIFPSDNKSEWALAVRTTIRCSKTAEKFILGHTVIEGNKFSIPGLYTYRSYPCPFFEKYSGPEGRK